MELDEDRVRNIVREELANFAPQKKKRAPNKWQIFLKTCAQDQDKELPYTEKVKICSIKYKENKGGIPDSKSSLPESPQQHHQQQQLQQQSHTFVQPHVQPTIPAQPEQPVHYVQQPVQSAQPTYHTQQMNVMPLAEEDAERLLRLTSEKLTKTIRR